MDDLLAVKAAVDKVEDDVVRGAVEGGGRGAAVERAQEGGEVGVVAQLLRAIGAGEARKDEALLAGAEEGEVNRPHRAEARALGEEGNVLGGGGVRTRMCDYMGGGVDATAAGSTKKPQTAQGVGPWGTPTCGSASDGRTKTPGVPL